MAGRILSGNADRDGGGGRDYRWPIGDLEALSLAGEWGLVLASFSQFFNSN